MNNIQEVFEYVAAHLIKQGKPSLASYDSKRKEYRYSGGCSYRGANGTSCAVGCLIPDDEYKVVLEWVSVIELLSEKHVPTLTSLNENIEGLESMLLDLQVFHDNDHNWDTEGFSQRGIFMLNQIASDHGCKTGHLLKKNFLTP